jgi:hypothetical protein
MKKYDVYLMPDAIKDLENIYGYISDKSGFKVSRASISPPAQYPCLLSSGAFSGLSFQADFNGASCQMAQEECQLEVLVELLILPIVFQIATMEISTWLKPLFSLNSINFFNFAPSKLLYLHHFLLPKAISL